MDFETEARDAGFWFTQSNQMLAASESLFCSMSDPKSEMEASVGFHKGSMFLLGISLENAFKGVVASKGRLKIEGGKLSAKKSFPGCKNHNLNDLAQLIDFDTTDAEWELLKRLSIYTVWAGKYGTPLTESEYLNDQGHQHQRPDDFDIARILMLRLREISECD